MHSDYVIGRVRFMARCSLSERPKAMLCQYRQDYFLYEVPYRGQDFAEVYDSRGSSFNLHTVNVDQHGSTVVLHGISEFS